MKATPHHTTLAFLIEDSMSEWTKTPECPTRERAAADAILARYEVQWRSDLEPTDPLDVEAITLFRVGGGSSQIWGEFTERQKEHWRAVATKAREMYRQ